MEELRDLNQMAKLASARFSVYDGFDIELPQLFKDTVTEINSNSIKYNRYSAVIETKGYQNGTLNIYMPNQWFFVASYFTDLYNEMMKYKKYALQITSKERLKVLNGNSLTSDESLSLQNLDLSQESKGFLEKFITDYSWWGGAKTIDRGDFYVSPILSHAKLVNASQSFVADLCAFLADKKELVGAILNGEEGGSETSRTNKKPTLQQIYYGAPGTGKSYKISEITSSTKNFTRTTFHPDSDYSTFVGCYKPTMESTGTIVAGKEQTKISYSYVAQAFLQAYTAAWKNTSEPYYLIIEEINRGNCAQIFGDLFQLLDRNEDGISSYGITPDKDIANYLKNEFKDFNIENADIKNGKIMLLPSNLFILATMNTSDQSLFPIDSAFKRRWDWEYVPIEDAGKKHYIKVGNRKYDWWTFIDTINGSIDKITGSEDKKMGYWFVKPQNKDREITAKQFVSKVLFYLWNDVYKDFYDSSQSIFKVKNPDGSDEKKPFTYFFGSEAESRIQAFMEYNKIPYFIEETPGNSDDSNAEDPDADNNLIVNSETENKRHNLWTLFNQLMKSNNRTEATREAPTSHNYDIPFRGSGAYIRNTVHVVAKPNNPSSVYCELFFRPNAQSLYEFFEPRKEELSELLGKDIVWRISNGNNIGKIERVTNFNNETDKNAGMEWLATTSAKVYDFMKPIIEENK